MACVDCHQVHYGSVAERYAELARLPARDQRYGQPLTEHVGTKKTQPELCLQCHQMRRAQLQRSSHMPYHEGKVTCTSCHNPHGSPNQAQLIQATLNENCLSCHTERRGPFLWEHPPVMENCPNCHEPPPNAAATAAINQELQPRMHELPFPNPRIESPFG